MNSKFLLPFNLGILDFLIKLIRNSRIPRAYKDKIKDYICKFKKRLLLGKFLRVGRLKP